MSEKPKRVLTEAQRLAFLKGREKRMANIERRRLEKEEAAHMENVPSTPVPEPSLEKDAPVGIDKPRAKSPEIISPPPQVPTASVPVIDYDEIAKRVVARMAPPVPKPKRPYVRRTAPLRNDSPQTPPRSPSPPPPPPPARTMTMWL